MNNKIKFNRSLRFFLYILSDVTWVLIVFTLATYLRFLLGEIGFFPEFKRNINYFINLFPQTTLIYILINLYEGIYFSRKLFWEEAKDIVKIVTMWIILLFAYLSITKEIENFSRILIILIWVLSLISFPLFHYFTKMIFLKMKIFQVPVIIIGTDELSLNTAKGLIRQKYLGYNIIGFFSSNLDPHNNLLKIDNCTYPILGSFENLENFLNKNEIWTGIIAIESIESKELTHIINLVQKYVRRVIVIPNLFGVSLTNTEVLYLFEEGLFLLKITNKLKSSTNRFIKRIFDITISMILLPLLLPIILIIGVLIKLDSPGPIFYIHHRIGKNGKKIPVLKFRSMFINSQEILEKLINENPEIRKEWEENFKLKKDPRITKIGKFLRRTSLDELPQIFNVLIGQMSLVGPRPVLQEELDRYYGEYAEYYYMVPPGITGLWQVSGRSNTSYEFRVWIDTWYVLNWSVWMDIVILFKTIKSVIKMDGAC
ncbi:MAG: undecaprenyl-phosphate galactose phosphotransferase WbaP [Candidatus Micrarchaeia archaeon]